MTYQRTVLLLRNQQICSYIVCRCRNTVKALYFVGIIFSRFLKKAFLGGHNFVNFDFHVVVFMNSFSWGHKFVYEGKEIPHEILRVYSSIYFGLTRQMYKQHSYTSFIVEMPSPGIGNSTSFPV